MVAVEVVTLAAVALLVVLVVGLLRSNAELLRALHALGVDLGGDAPAARTTPVSLSVRPTPARPDAGHVPDLVGTTPAGDAVGVPVAGVGHDTLVTFLTSGCTTCQGFWEVLRAGRAAAPGGARVVVVTRGAEAESPAAVAALAGDATVVMSTEAWQTYDVPYAPYAIYVSGSRSEVVGEGAAASWDAMTTLIQGALADGGDRIDRDLAAAGILPGDPRLHHTTLTGGPEHGPPPPT